MKKQLTSVFESIQQQVYDAKSFDDARNIIYNKLNESRINKNDEALIRHNIEKIKEEWGEYDKTALNKLWKYFTNSIFAYKGMSVR